MSELILTSLENGIFEISLNRPDKRNALNWPMMQGLDNALDEAERAFNSGQARVIFIRGNGPAFSSGIDLMGFPAYAERFGDRFRENLFSTTALLQGIFNKLENHSLPSIALLHGYCLGMGFEMALACDLRLAAAGTRIGLPETRLGLVPDVGGTTRLLNLVGPARAKDLILTGRNIRAEQAEVWGIINSITSEDNLVEQAHAYANQIMQGTPHATSYAKRVINDMMDNHRKQQIEAWAQSALMRMEDFERAVQAMIMKASKKD